MSTENWNSIIDIDTTSGFVRVQPGVITQVLQDEVSKHMFYYPPDPASRGSCTIGGNIAEDSAGPHSFKYGTTRHYVLNLKIITGTSQTLWTGSWTTKNATGYNLTQLIVGSEGTLCIITEAVLKIISAPPPRYLILIAFNTNQNAILAIEAILKTGTYPSAIEFMEGIAVKTSRKYLKEMGQTPVDLPDAKAFLFVELEHESRESFNRTIEKIYESIKQLQPAEMLIAETASEQEKLWAIRRVTGHAVKAISNYIDADTIVPRARLPQLLDTVKTLETRYGLRTICYGHAGDGNIHVNILQEQHPEEEWKKLVDSFMNEIFSACLKMGGALTGEHGTGLVHRHRMGKLYPPHYLNVLKQIKQIFDPYNIINPGKIF